MDIQKLYGKAIVRTIKPQTNADRIRSMSDEELAVYLHTVEEHLFEGNLWDYEQWDDWLGQEVDNG